jgi:DNA-directed RNA polymerase specialized sigma24 family protein
MARNSVIPREAFDEILGWLNPDREAAANIYVQLCHDLTKIFVWNKCGDPEGLTDEVVDRVAKKIHAVKSTFVGDPKLYFYGVARNVIKEMPNKVKAHVSLEGVDLAASSPDEIEEESEIMREECLHNCLRELTIEKRDLILRYYAKEKQAKIDERLQMARELRISIETLRVRALRIRNALEACIKACLDCKRPTNDMNCSKVH